MHHLIYIHTMFILVQLESLYKNMNHISQVLSKSSCGFLWDRHELVLELTSFLSIWEKGEAVQRENGPQTKFYYK